MRKTVLLWMLACFGLLYLSGAPGLVFGAQRTALVIGNSAYDTAPLKNPVNDAVDMAKALRGLGFDVIEKTNANKREMIFAVDEFAKRLRDAEIGVFYFAGHGMQIQGRNYLIPVKAHVTSETDVQFEAMDAGRVLGKMQDAGNKLNIVILDACRDNPFKRSFRTEQLGLAQMDAPKGSIIAYATAPGTVLVRPGNVEVSASDSTRLSCDISWLKEGVPVYVYIFSHPWNQNGSASFSLESVQFVK